MDHTLVLVLIPKSLIMTWSLVLTFCMKTSCTPCFGATSTASGVSSVAVLMLPLSAVGCLLRGFDLAQDILTKWKDLQSSQSECILTKHY